MSYTPSPVPATPAEIPAYLDKELRAISLAFTSKQQLLYLQTLAVPPTKLRDGLIAKADGTNWNPGSGAGVYCYRGAAWTFLG